MPTSTNYFVVYDARQPLKVSKVCAVDIGGGVCSLSPPPSEHCPDIYTKDLDLWFSLSAREAWEKYIQNTQEGIKEARQEIDDGFAGLRVAVAELQKLDKEDSDGQRPAAPLQ